ncbi:hypothetical protein [Archangium lansingense]|uniref:Uncharacterized protein n=1 Tax=Archangium lansingense TaxID=2995310 RepID=A0ABT4A3C0_9BACT|nr:hypothetical protein [Archangium lansinium]MCY1076139.1 hypothetical protein [Archangium lansinium]
MHQEIFQQQRLGALWNRGAELGDGLLGVVHPILIQGLAGAEQEH